MARTDDADETVDGGSWGSGEREPDPSDTLRTFGAVVQALREHAGLGRAEFGERICFSRHTVESLELGRRMADDAFVEKTEGETGNTGALRKASAHLKRGEPGWRRGSGDGRGWRRWR